MNPIFILLILIVILLPLAWLASEFQHRIWLRILLGISAFSSAAAIAFTITLYFSIVDEIESNSFFGFQNKQLIEETIHALRDGKSAKVLEQLEHMNAEYHPSYENRADYEKLVSEYVQNLKTGSENVPD